MFEHMKNYEKLMAKVSDWLSPGGKIFIHIFTHKKFAYHFTKGKLTKIFELPDIEWPVPTPNQH